MIVQPVVEPMEHYTALVLCRAPPRRPAQPPPRVGVGVHALVHVVVVVVPVIVVVVVVAVVEVVVDVHQGVDGEEDEGKEGEGVEACLRGTAGGLAGPRLSLRGQEVGHQAGDSLHLLTVRDCGSRSQSGDWSQVD